MDFEIQNVNYKPDDTWTERLDKGEITENDLRTAIGQYNNVIQQIECLLRVVK